MKLSRRIVVSGLFLVCAAQVQCTFGPGLSTPDQRAKVVALTRSLERDPLGNNAPAARQWLRKWIIEVPDIRSTRAMICSVTVWAPTILTQPKSSSSRFSQPRRLRLTWTILAATDRFLRIRISPAWQRVMLS